jgi:phosphoserine phosphatase
MRLILTRHGETIENTEGRIMGHLPGKLSAKGADQAKMLAARLKAEKIDHIYSSDLARSADTAKEVARFHPATPVDYTTELREKHMGEHQGKMKSELGFKGADSISLMQAPGGETNEQIYLRAERFLHAILKKHKDDVVLVIGHNAINKAIIAAITGRKHGELDSIINLDNTSVSIFEIDEQRNHKIHLLNCTKHLG